MLKTFYLLDLILLHVKLFKVYESLKAADLLDKICLHSYEGKISQAFEPLNFNELIFCSMELCEVLKLLNVFNLTNFVVADIQNFQSG